LSLQKQQSKAIEAFINEIGIFDDLKLDKQIKKGEFHGKGKEILV